MQRADGRRRGGESRVNVDAEKKNGRPRPCSHNSRFLGSLFHRALSLALSFSHSTFWKAPPKPCSFARRSGACATSARFRHEGWPPAAAVEGASSSRPVRDERKREREQRRRPMKSLCSYCCFSLYVVVLSRFISLNLAGRDGCALSLSPRERKRESSRRREREQQAKKSK